MPHLTPAEYLTQLRRIARAHAGRLLSRRYLGDATKLRWRCAVGHVFRQAPTHVKQGKWCRTCGVARRAEIRKAPARARLYKVVAERGGAVISPEYVSSQTKLRFRCAQGHEWEAVPNSIVQGKWCRRCRIEERLRSHGRPWGKSEATARAVRRRFEGLVRRRGGRILAPGFISFDVPIRFRCRRGHTWTMSPASVRDGGWCRECREESRINQLRELAERWGGRCLAERCDDLRQVLWWQCLVGHRFMSPGARITRGGWCPICRGTRRADIVRMQRLAHERGGLCLSVRYVGTRSKLRWQCREGHVWSTAPNNVVNGRWCPICGRRSGDRSARPTIEDMRWIAAERGGLCLSDTYQGSMVHVRWRCARGHAWSATPNRVRQGTWCPVCAHSVMGTIEGMRALAQDRGGRCLSRTWNDHSRPLRFKCARGHRFHLHGGAVRTGVWCPRCGPPSGPRAPQAVKSSLVLYGKPRGAH